ncbi:MAG: MATE family efflux transporter, partial [Rikenellaceae bacterium]|nr:MATE family efflux transporter [Rikenellaceae bacterium]
EVAGLAGLYSWAVTLPTLPPAFRGLVLWGAGVMLLFTVVYAAAGQQILGIFTPSPAILDAARNYSVWAVLVPVCSFLAFILDGIVVGITATWIMRNAMFVATLFFFGVYFLLEPRWGNSGLWIAFLIYLFLRGVVQLALSKRRILG